jgi:hypothetical protein
VLFSFLEAHPILILLPILPGPGPTGQRPTTPIYLALSKIYRSIGQPPANIFNAYPESNRSTDPLRALNTHALVRRQPHTNLTLPYLVTHPTRLALLESHSTGRDLTLVDNRCRRTSTTSYPRLRPCPRPPPPQLPRELPKLPPRIARLLPTLSHRACSSTSVAISHVRRAHRAPATLFTIRLPFRSRRPPSGPRPVLTNIQENDRHAH